MERDFIIAIFSGLGGMLGWGFADFFAKKTMDKIGDLSTLAWSHLFGTMTFFVAQAYQLTAHPESVVIPTAFKTWFFLWLFGSVQATIYFFVYKGFAKGQVGILSPVFASFSGLSALMSVLLFQEAFNPSLFWRLAILFIGILLVNFQGISPRGPAFKGVPGLTEVLIATVLASFWTVFWDQFIGEQHWLVATSIMYTLMTAMIFITSAWQRVHLQFQEKGVWKFLIAIGFFETAAFASVSLGYHATTLTSVIALLSGGFALPVMILSRLFLSEKISFIQTVGSLAIVAGVMLITIL